MSHTVRHRITGACIALLLVLLAPSADAVRVKDIARVDGVRSNQLIGYGLVVGLDRTGDSQRTTFTLQSLSAMLSRVGIRIDPKQLLLRNVAAVMVTASLPPFAQPGNHIDVMVSSIGDARSLVGGTLLLTPLNGVNGETYALCQGALQVGGVNVEAKSGSRFSKGHLNVGRIPNGAIVERAVPVKLANGGNLNLQLEHPDFQTASRLAQAVNAAAAQLGGQPGFAKAMDGARVQVTVPEAQVESIALFVAQIEQLDVTPDTLARVVINGRTGTVVMGEFVRISSVAVAHGPLTIEVDEQPAVSQPNPLAAGDTTVVDQSQITVDQGDTGALKVLAAGTTLADVVQALNTLGASAQDLVAILQAIKAAGALHAELEVL